MSKRFKIENPLYPHVAYEVTGNDRDWYVFVPGNVPTKGC